VATQFSKDIFITIPSIAWIQNKSHYFLERPNESEINPKHPPSNGTLSFTSNKQTKCHKFWVYTREQVWREITEEITDAAMDFGRHFLHYWPSVNSPSGSLKYSENGMGEPCWIFCSDSTKKKEKSWILKQSFVTCFLHMPETLQTLSSILNLH
jgi:Pyruvate/2-oxoacid:ferredoxin oxidoreductase delta subunit